MNVSQVFVLIYKMRLIKKSKKQTASAHLEVETSLEKDVLKFRGICLIVFLSAFLILASVGLTSAEDTIQNFDSAGTSYTLSNHYGDPATIESGGLTGNFLMLVRGYSQSQRNSIAFNATLSDTCSQVIADFDFRLITMLNTGGDGFGFALLNISVFGTTGDGPPLSEEPNLHKSLGIGFDAYWNKNVDDPDGNHLSLHFNGATIATFPIPKSQPPLENGFITHAQIVVDFDRGRVTVTLTPLRGIPFSPIDDYPIPGLTPYASRVAFGASNGSATVAHHLDNIRVQFLGHN